MADKLKETISILYDMELNNYLMTRAISELDDEIDSLGRKRRFNEPTQMQADSLNTNVSNITAYAGFGIGAIFCILAIVILVVIDFNFLLVVPISLIVYLITGLIVAAVTYSIVIAKNNRRYKKRYDKECEEYDSKLKKDSLRVESENKKKRILIKQRDLLIERKKEAVEILNSFYIASGIDRAYRNIVPIGYMNDFIRLGIATKLEGADGLYYLIRNELRFDQMNYTLNEISHKLDKIIDNQHKIHSELTHMNYKCDKILRETKRTAELTERNNDLLNNAVVNTAITAYNTERIACEAEHQSRMAMLYY